jgi:nucleoside-diphosphate-sugar epimerase
MIIGNGIIANSLKNIDSGENLFFASGVSNSLETRDSEFEREFYLLKDALQNSNRSKLVYFSTLSVNDQSKQNSRYVIHKLKIEDYIKHNSENYLILRLGNIVGKGGNPNTLFNFLKNQIMTNTQFTVHRKARRLLLDIDDATRFLNSYCAGIKNETLNFAYPHHYDVKKIIDTIQQQMQKKADYIESDEGDFYKVNFDHTTNEFFEGITADKYLKILVEKYI